MKIECPSCHINGNLNELEIPPEGRNVTCPRCKESFHVKKPAAAAWAPFMMNICPKCQYSTFSEEMFAVCPKCGLDGRTHHEAQNKQTKQEKGQQRSQLEIQQQLERDREKLQQSFRNPDLDVPSAETADEPVPMAPLPVRITGWASTVLAAALLCYGLFGLMSYYGKDWQAELSAKTVIPVSGTEVFFQLGFSPWLMTLYGAALLAASILFLRIYKFGRKWLDWSAWGGVATACLHELAELIRWIRSSSSSPSISYYLVGIINTLFMAALWVAPFLALLWYLRSDAIMDEFPE